MFPYLHPLPVTPTLSHFPSPPLQILVTWRTAKEGLHTLQVSPEDLPDTEPDDKQYVYLVAQSLSSHLAFIKYTKILVSPRNAVVFIQTDKPIYTPGQTGMFLFF